MTQSHSSPLESAGCYPLDVVRSNTAVSETYAGTDGATFLESPERREILEVVIICIHYCI